ncbi:flagellin [Salsuginibacillus kocurii]|uniref:flagellin N-terminal helical domain-containing protein n=1 Tax=Salsuginibacillus kocurii TaxID=427078 RepID=UPI0003795019|nr:flagellin [Salsuginibacillus kocurii]
MIINTNVTAMNAHRQMGINQGEQQSAMEKLSSGQQINRAGDDAAGLSISEKMRAQVRGLDQASTNAQDSISLIQTAEGALDESHDILQRMRELSVQSANDTNVDEDRDALQAEVDQLAEELSRISENTEFNTQELLDDSFEGTFHIGANEGQNLELSIDDMGSNNLGVVADAELLDDDGEIVTGTDDEPIGPIDGHGLEAGTYTIGEEDVEVNGETFSDETVLQDSSGNTVAVENENGEFYALDSLELDTDDAIDFGDATQVINVTDEGNDLGNEISVGGIDISSQEAADSAITDINDAIESVSEQRSNLGAVQNRLEHTIDNLDNASENLSAAESRIRDTDMAQEMMNQTSANILNQASQSMLAQANQEPQNVLQLLQ